MAREVANWVPYVAAHVPSAPDPVIEDAILEAARTFCRETELYVDGIPSLAYIPEDNYHSYSSGSTIDVIRFTRVTWGGKRLELKTREQLDRIDPKFEAGGVTKTSADPDYAASWKENHLMLYPNRTSWSYLDIASVTLASPGIITTSAAHGLSTTLSNPIHIKDTGVSEIDTPDSTGRYGLFATVLSDTTFTVSKTIAGAAINTTSSASTGSWAKTKVIDLRCVLTPKQDATTLPDEVYNYYRRPIVLGAAADLLMMPTAPWANEKAGLLMQARFEEAMRMALRDQANPPREVKYGGY